MAAKSIFSIVVLAALLPFLYERSHSAFLFYKHTPDRLERVNTFASHEIRFADRIRSCEDALLVESLGVAILACDPGRERWNTVMGVFLPNPIDNANLYIFDYKNREASDDEALKKLNFVNFDFTTDFHTLGMAYNETSSTLYVTNHRRGDGSGTDGTRAAVEVFQLDLTSLTATHLHSIQHPLIRGPNSIALINEHSFYVTNSNHFLAREHPILNKLEVSLGLPGGTVVYVNTDSSSSSSSSQKDIVVEASIAARLPFANGIELFNATTAVVSSSGGAKVVFYTIINHSTTSPKFRRVSELRVPFAPDNLAISADGGLLIAGHPHIPSLGKFTQSRAVCNSADALAGRNVEEERGACSEKAPSWAARWTADTGLVTLYADTEYPSSATAARDSERGVGIISGLYAKGILVWRE